MFNKFAQDVKFKQYKKLLMMILCIIWEKFFEAAVEFLGKIKKSFQQSETWQLFYCDNIPNQHVIVIVIVLFISRSR